MQREFYKKSREFREIVNKFNEERGARFRMLGEVTANTGAIFALSSSCRLSSS